MDEANAQLRVLHVVSGDLWAGAEVQTYTLLKQLAKGCRVYAVVLNHGTLAEKLSKADIETTVLDETKLGFSSLLRQLIALFHRIQPNIIHTHRVKENTLSHLAGKVARLNPTPRYIKTVHGAREHTASLKSSLLQALDRKLTNLDSTKIISVSRELRPSITAQHPGCVVTVIENGVDQQSIQQQSKAALPEITHSTGKQVAFIGRLVPVKRVDVFLGAIRCILAATNEQYHFHVVGDGPLLSSLKQLAVKYDIEKQVSFHGHRSDIPAFLAKVDIVVMCSEHEGTPMTVLEAIALGKKLALHDTGGLTSIAKLHQLTPYSPNTPEALARAIVKAQQPTTLNESYTIERCAAATLKIYQDE